MNNLYLQERLVELKQQEVRREVEQARWLREAGLAGEGWPARLANVLRNLLERRRKGAQDHQPVESQPVRP